MEVGPATTMRKKVTLKLSDKLAAGRHVFVLRVFDAGNVEPGDGFVVVDVGEERR